MNRVLLNSGSGKMNWSHYIVPSVVLFGPISYMAYHDFCLDKTQKFHSIKEGDHEKQVNIKLGRLISKVTEDTKDEISVIKGLSDRGKHSPFAFFYSLYPLYVGRNGSKSGSIIGLPLYLDYEVPSDIPSDQLNIRVLPTLRISQEAVAKVEKVDLDKNLEKLLMMLKNEHKSFRVDIETENGQNYVNSLLLSENAKKFLIARQIFYTDTNQVMINYFMFAICGMIPMTFSKLLAVLNIKPILRIPLRAIIFTLGLAQGLLLKDLIQRYYDEKSDALAAGLSNEYLEGGLEYYSKCIQRNLALKKMDKMCALYIDGRGNIKTEATMFRIKEVPLTDRLRLLSKLKL